MINLARTALLGTLSSLVLLFVAPGYAVPLPGPYIQLHTVKERIESRIRQFNHNTPQPCGPGTTSFTGIDTSLVDENGNSISPLWYSTATMFPQGIANTFGQLPTDPITGRQDWPKPDIFGYANWVNSPLPKVDCNGNLIAGTGLRKFVDGLATLCVAPPAGSGRSTGNANNNLGQCIPVAQQNNAAYNDGAPFYQLSVEDYSHQFHTDLGIPTPGLRGYNDLAANPNPTESNLSYLGPMVIATRNLPTRMTIKNNLKKELELPIDTSYASAGFIESGPNQEKVIADTKRVATHLHGGNSPWVSDGTPEQTVVPANTTSQPALVGYKKGWSATPVPDMVQVATPGDPSSGCNATNPGYCVPGSKNLADPVTLNNGYETKYYTNYQSGRLLWYHDHAAALTRLNVYAGLAAPYLIVDPCQETELQKTYNVPGAIITQPRSVTSYRPSDGALITSPQSITCDWTLDPNDQTKILPTTLMSGTSDLSHVIPLVIQDKTFVPDNGEQGGQLASMDPTWPSQANKAQGYLGLQATGEYSWDKSHLWFPHVYTPNQNAWDDTGANPWGRWDYGSWFWPPYLNIKYPEEACTSIAYLGSNKTPLVLQCPGIMNPSGTPESFMDTPVVNGVAYPSMTVDPTAYRFHVLNGTNDRALNLGLYVAEPLSVSILNPGSGYTQPPKVTFSGGNGSGAAATAQISTTGTVTTVWIANGGTGYTSAPTVQFTNKSGCSGSGATATAKVSSGNFGPFGQKAGRVIEINITNPGSGYTCPPIVGLNGGGGNGARAYSQIQKAGTVVGITVTNPGQGYTTANPPKVTLSAPCSGGILGCKPVAGSVTATAAAAVNTEVKMVPAVPHYASSSPPLCPPSSLPDNFQGQPYGADASGLEIAKLDSSGNPVNGTGIQSGCWPLFWPTDGRDGGVPDPATVGPAIVQIGSEGGLLPAPVAIPSTPVSYEYNRRSITVLNIFNHGLLMGGAERADVVVDFSKYAGKTLILYNDAPAPVPAFDPRLDYYTNDPDQTSAGGAPRTIAGLGPNTRTLMQIKVNSSGTGSNFRYSALAQNQPTLFNKYQLPILVNEPDYANLGIIAPNGSTPTDHYVRIQDSSLILKGGSVQSVELISGTPNYITPPQVLFKPNPADTQKLADTGKNAVANATVGSAGSVASITPGPTGAGYTTPPTVTIGASPSGNPGDTATAKAALAGTPGITVNVTNGGQYCSSTPPTVSIGGCNGITATATMTGKACGLFGASATNSYKVASINVIVNSPTAGFTCPSATPSVSIAAPTGFSIGQTKAAASATTTGVGVTLSLLTGGGGYTTAPLVTFSPSLGNPSASTTLSAIGGNQFHVNMIDGGTNYHMPPSIVLSGGTCNGSCNALTFKVTLNDTAQKPLIYKTIQELFTIDFGRMNATLGIELPYTSQAIQTTQPMVYIDPVTEIVKDSNIDPNFLDDPMHHQLWKVVHNGVDTHFIHFHLFDVQLINRIGWDGAVKPPSANELGFKDTVRMNPLEIAVVALRPRVQEDLKLNPKRKLPWKLPNNIRPLDTSRPLGYTDAVEGWENPGNEWPFTNFSPFSGNKVTPGVTNILTNFGWEYVWHCHILGHEENDMMRSVDMTVKPTPPTNIGRDGSGHLTWEHAILDESDFRIWTCTTAGSTPEDGTCNVPSGENIAVVTNNTGTLQTAVPVEPATYTSVNTYPAGRYCVQARNNVGYRGLGNQEENGNQADVITNSNGPTGRGNTENNPYIWITTNPVGVAPADVLNEALATASACYTIPAIP